MKGTHVLSAAAARGLHKQRVGRTREEPCEHRAKESCKSDPNSPVPHLVFLPIANKSSVLTEESPPAPSQQLHPFPFCKTLELG